MLGRGRAQAVAFDRLGHDPLHVALGHRHVGLVIELGHLARDPGEGDHRAGAGIGDPGHQRIERQWLDRDPHMRDPHRAAGHRRDQGQLVAGGQAVGVIGVLVVDRHDHRHVADDVAQPRQRVGHGCPVGEVQRDLVAAGALAQSGEEADGDVHGDKATPVLGGD